jgi:hypothetical protein
MNSEQMAIAYTVRLALALVLAGLLWRRRAGLCGTFALYVTTVLGCNLLITTWPSRFYTAAFYTWKEATYNVLILATAAELAWRAFRVFPQARRRAQFVLGAVLAASFLALTSLPWGLTYAELILEYNPRLQAGAMWLFTATAVLVAWYRLPVHHLQRAIALGFGLYLFVFTSSWNAVRDFGLADINLWRRFVDVAAGLVFALVATWWGYAAWRPHEPVEGVERALRVLGYRPA